MKQKVKLIVFFAACALMLGSCGANNSKKQDMGSFEKGTFGYDLNFLNRYDSVIVLSDKSGQAKVIVSPKYQAKVFTSTAEGNEGGSFGWINYGAFDKLTPHMNAYGGENRLWLGPEGGPFSIYFAPGAEQVYDNWQTAAEIDSEAWQLVRSDKSSATMRKDMSLTNYKGSQFSLVSDRVVTLLSLEAISSKLNVDIPASVKTVGYTTANSITNTGDNEWTKETGTIGIWILDMFTPSPSAVTVVPYVAGSEAELGKVATTDYFGDIPPQWLQIDEKAIYLKVDGKYRAKLGVGPKRAKPVAGNYDPDAKVLTITVFDVVKDALYLNQEWRLDADPFKGDAVNAYNDGPLEDGSQMGPFHEIESTSPAAFLKPGESMHHMHDVYHFVGSEGELTLLAQALLGVSIDEISKKF